MKETVLITGGTGFLGKALRKYLIENGYNVIILSRAVNTDTSTENFSYATWDVKNQLIDEEAIKAVDFIVHLAGAGVVAKKWTKRYKQEIINSRTESSRLLIDALNKIPNKVKAVISASAIGYYGPDKSNMTAFVETDGPDKSFLGQTCNLWEKSIEPVTLLNKRLVKLRIGIVLGNGGGAFDEFKKPVKIGYATILGDGNQVVSWIHLDDLCRLVVYSIKNDKIQGTYNAVATIPVTNKKLMQTLAKKMKPLFVIPIKVPSFILHLMMGDRSIEVLKSTTVSNKKIVETGFEFGYNEIETALQNLVKK